MRKATLAVYVIAWTAADLPLMTEATGGVWEPDRAGEGELLAEFAGRACYQSWSKPNPATATNAGYLAHIRDVRHGSVLEHGTATLYLTGVSRSLTHELIRHRHFSFSQLSQRYVPGDQTATVVPPLFADDPAALRILEQHQAATDAAYAALVERAEEILSGDPHCPTCGRPAVRSGPEHDLAWTCITCGKGLLRAELRSRLGATALRKQARQAARAVLPNAAETRIVVTGNYRAWRHFVELRGSTAADAEIRALAVACLWELRRVAPHVFADYQVITQPDRTETIETVHAGV